MREFKARPTFEPILDTPALVQPGANQRRLLLKAGGAWALGGLSGCAYSPWKSGGRWPLRSAEGLTPNRVLMSPAAFKGREALMIELTPERQKEILAGTGGVGNTPSFVMPPLRMANGMIEVDLAARINGKGQPDVRGFVGVAFHIDEAAESFEAVYLRMTNGSRNIPPPPAPRKFYAVQYISQPDRYWRKLRQEYPNQYEKAAPVAIETWHTLRLQIQDSTVEAFVDGEPVLTVKDLSYPNRRGRIGLWVDDGTTGYFTDLKVKVRD